MTRLGGSDPTTMAGEELIWIGIDLGTQSVRVLAVDGTGNVCGSGAEQVSGRRADGRHEQDPEDWWRAVASAARTAMAGLAGRPVGGVAVDGTSGTILVADADGVPLTAGLMYDDARGARVLDRVNEIGAPVWQQLGYGRMQGSWALPTLVALLADRPELAAPGHRLLHQPDLVTERLVGARVATDSSHALKTGFHLVDEVWPVEVMETLGVPLAMLPSVVRPGSVIGTVCPGAAELTGIPAGTPVVAGMTDGCAAQIGAGALEPGSWNSVLGTTLVLKGVTETLLEDPLGVVYSHRGPDGGWLPGGASSTGAGILTRDFPGRDLDALGSAAAERVPTGVVAYPLAGTGERFPFTAADAIGFQIGEPTDEVERFAALLQGVAYLERLCFDYVDLLGASTDGALSLTGGGARSRYWCQLRADVLGRSVQLPKGAGSALGMAALAASQAFSSTAAAAAAMVRVHDVIDPRPGVTARLTESYLTFVDELAGRGWLDATVAEHTRRRSNP